MKRAKKGLKREARKEKDNWCPFLFGERTGDFFLL